MASMSTTVLDSDTSSDDLTGETDNEINSFTLKNNLDIARQDKGSEFKEVIPNNKANIQHFESSKNATLISVSEICCNKFPTILRYEILIGIAMYIIIDPLLLKHENAKLQSQVQHLETTLREMLQKTYMNSCHGGEYNPISMTCVEKIGYISTWNRAMQICRRKGGHLITFKNREAALWLAHQQKTRPGWGWSAWIAVQFKDGYWRNAGLINSQLTFTLFVEGEKDHVSDGSVARTGSKHEHADFYWYKTTNDPGWGGHIAFCEFIE